MFLEHVLLKNPFQKSVAYLVRLQLVRTQLGELHVYSIIIVFVIEIEEW